MHSSTYNVVKVILVYGSTNSTNQISTNHLVLNKSLLRNRTSGLIYTRAQHFKVYCINSAVQMHFPNASIS